jgi:CheY-like chemotaxis protein
MSQAPSDDDLLLDDELLADDESGTTDAPPSSANGQPNSLAWRVLVVDDEPDVLLMTKLALQGLTVDGVPVTLLMVGSAAEARRVLTETPDVAVAIVDVIMEDLTAGLDLVRWIRERLPDDTMRLVLRTGQPGHTPEAVVMAQYDIHDYLGKAETTARRLTTCVMGAVRAWRDIWTIRRQRQGLQRALGAVGALFETPGLQELLAAILDQVTGLLLPRRSSLLLVGLPTTPDDAAAAPTVLAATGKYAGSVGRPMPDVLPPPVLAELAPQLHHGGVVRVSGLVGYGFDVTSDLRPLLLIDGGPLQPWEQELVELYCHSVTLALRNRRLWEQ